MPKTKYPKSDIQWSYDHFNRMNIGGVWMVPRSGLIFTRTGPKTLSLTTRIPWEKQVPCSKETLEAIQQEDFECIKARFEAAGILVTDGNPNLN